MNDRIMNVLEGKVPANLQVTYNEANADYTVTKLNAHHPAYAKATFVKGDPVSLLVFSLANQLEMIGAVTRKNHAEALKLYYEGLRTKEEYDAFIKACVDLFVKKDPSDPSGS